MATYGFELRGRPLLCVGGVALALLLCFGSVTHGCKECFWFKDMNLKIGDFKLSTNSQRRSRENCLYGLSASAWNLSQRSRPIWEDHRHVAFTSTTTWLPRNSLQCNSFLGKLALFSAMCQIFERKTTQASQSISPVSFMDDTGDAAESAAEGATSWQLS